VTILLDTNFLLIPAQFGIDIYHELNCLISTSFELIIFQGIIDELEKLSKKSIKYQKQVQLALQLAKNCKKIELNPEIFSDMTVDDIIVRLATDNGWLVATNDRELRKKLKAHQVTTIFLRKKRILSIEGDLPL